MGRRSIARCAAAATAIVVLAIHAAVISEAAAEPITLTTKAVQLVFGEPNVERVGSLQYLGGLALSSPDADFGGVSGLIVEGDRLTAVTDRGFWFRATLETDADHRFVGVADASLAPILSSRGEPLRISRGEHDAEALELWNGRLAVSFERFHRLALYDRDGGDLARPTYVADIPQLAAQPRNGGIESLASLGDGRLLALSEELATYDGRVAGWLIDGGARALLSYQLSRWKPTDAAHHPRIGVLVLERRFSGLGGFSARIRLIETADIQPGARLDGPIVARFEAPTVTDNFEGLAIAEDEDGLLTVWIVSDDNFSFLQRTLLLAFRWDPR